jgi:two-component system OmpR family response regulator
MRILIIEDDKQTSDYIVKGFKEAGHVAEAISDGRNALSHATGEDYDVLIVDRMLPGLDGLSLVKALRVAGIKTPAIFLTSVGGLDDRVEGLEAGGDDYLVKPFAFSELAARVNALNRRPPFQVEKSVISIDDLEVDLMRRTVRRGGKLIDLQPREYRLLEVKATRSTRPSMRSYALRRSRQGQDAPASVPLI